MIRKFPFEGNDAAYIEFLEAQVLQLQDYLQQTSQQHTENEAPLRSTANLNERRNQDETFENYNRNTCESRYASEVQYHSDSVQPAPEDLEHRHLHKGDGDSAALKVIEYDPKAHIDRNGTDKCPRNQSNEPQRQQLLAKLTTSFNNLPRSAEWKNWVSIFNSNQRRQFLRDLIQTCGSSASSFGPQTTPKILAGVPSNSTNIAILSNYANSMVSFGILDRQLGNFRQVLFVSLCAVVLETVEDKDNVFEVMRKIMGSDTSSKQLMKLVRGAKWVNSFISLLSTTKWASMSWDAICVAGLPVTFYARVSDSSLDPQTILDGMKTDAYECNTSSDCANSPAPFAIPLIVNAIFGDSASWVTRIFQDFYD
ncbi:hypothetical protein N7532_001412 [Penicillium argentinense]|uniref:Uncharacterized protein n=1 Tax=Penicillium argentinense TaxID=1131581 RepID=A0A9W9G2J8_9EURO|nr:uncharacterized protein N7532_001412 [Penicillium argentinense]KAJ5110877.1 hypothetical protein N7532_001412 [Penicillium argentinense]